MDTMHPALHRADERQLTEKQRLWAGVYRCAIERWHRSGNADEGEWATMVAALGLGDRFWE